MQKEKLNPMSKIRQTLLLPSACWPLGPLGRRTHRGQRPAGREGWSILWVGSGPLWHGLSPSRACAVEARWRKLD